MFKKVLIAAIAVVVGLAVVKGTWLGSHLRLRACKIGSWAKQQVPPEQEIARLRMELKNLERFDDEHYDKVARLAVQVDKLERDVAKLRGNVSKEEAKLKKLHEGLADNTEFVLHEGTRYTREDLRSEALAFKAAEENLKSKEANLQAKRKLLTLEKKKLSELRTSREQMATELQRLETDLVQERQAQAASESTIDDAGYRKLREDMNSVRDRIEILKAKRALRGEFRTSETKDEQSRLRDAQADKFLDARFGKVKEVAGK
jgi:septal ring factor EnvC (AmiA/AmiB activator)